MLYFDDFENFNEIYPIRDKNEHIPHQLRDPHYTDKRFTREIGGKTIFLAEGVDLSIGDFGSEYVQGAFYNYSDRILEGFGYDKVNRAHEDARKQIGNNDTPAYYEAMLQRVYEKPNTVLQHIIAGVNLSDGYSYHVYGTIEGN